MFLNFLDFVKSPQFVIESTDLALAFNELDEECDDFSSSDLQEAMDNIFHFHCEMIMSVTS